MSAPSWTPAPSSVKIRTPEGGQLGHGRQPLPGPAHGDGPGHRHLGQRPPTEGQHLAGRARRVDGRLGVGHGHHRRVAPERRRPGAGLDRLGLFPAGLAQVGVQVDQPGGHQAAAGVEHGRPGRHGHVGLDGHHRAALDDHVGSDHGPTGVRTDHRAAPDDDDGWTGRPARRHAGDRRPGGDSPSSATPDPDDVGHLLATDGGRVRPEQQEEHGHPHRHAVGHLSGDHRAGAGRPRRRRSPPPAPSGPGG